ncbi:MAG: MATE family efflux transporter [Allorhizobium sp.]
MSSGTSTHNAYLSGPIAGLFVKTALPIVFVMSMNGFLTVVDAIFLGVFVGPEAVGAVTVVFPVYMLIVALAALVSAGMSSVLARNLGAGWIDEAQGVFAGAHMLALAISASLIAGFIVFGDHLTLRLANGSLPLYRMAYTFITVVIFGSPLQFLLSVQADALRSEGRAGLMAAMSLVVSLANIGFNYLFIAGLDWGVAGSAYGTALAQGLALCLLVVFRLFGRTDLRLSALLRHRPTAAWRPIVSLGAPQSLGFIGLAGISATIIAALQISAGDRYQAVVSGYGIITRIITFAYLPLLGMSQAMQSMVGNNVGARLWQRSNDSLRFGLMAALLYCLAVECLLVGAIRPVSLLFVSEDAVVGEVARIMPVMVAMYVVSGPLVMLTGYFQAIGDAGRAAFLGLSKPYLFTMPLIIGFALVFGERGIWFATPIADLMLLVLAVVVLAQTARQHGLAWGLFMRDR